MKLLFISTAKFIDAVLLNDYILDIQANGVYTLQIIGSDEVNIMGFSRNDRFLCSRFKYR